MEITNYATRLTPFIRPILNYDFRRRGRWAIIPDRNMSHPRLSSAIKLLGELIAFNTQSAKSNLSLVEHVSDYLQSIGIKSATRLDESGEKASLLAHVGPAKNGGVALSGHTDVVDALGQKWQTPPFEITEKDGKLYGRGSCDMKGFIACVLASLPDFLAADLRLPAHVALSRDEELGSIGMKDMLALIEESGLRPAAAIVGEPTCMAVVAGHKAGCEMKPYLPVLKRTVPCPMPASAPFIMPPALLFFCRNYRQNGRFSDAGFSFFSALWHY